MGRGTANPFAALMSGFGFVLGRPLRTLGLEILFGALGVLPLIAWLRYGPVWDGADPGDFALVVGGQQLVVLLRVLTRSGELGAASAWLGRSRDAGETATAEAAPEEKAAEPPAEPAPEPEP
jgi:hypothetical protein